MRAGQALLLRSVLPTRPHIGAYHPALGADSFRAQFIERRIIRPSISVDRRAVMAEPGGATDQEPPAAVGPQVPQGDGRALVALRSSSRRVVVRARARIARLACVSARGTDAAA